MGSVFTKSENFKEEYCCSIVRVGELKPIEGADKIAQTLLNGESIVVRKDQVKEGDIVFYASNETQLNADFLSANNLFAVDSWELNANHESKVETANLIESLKTTLATQKKLIPKIDKAIKSNITTVLEKFVKKYGGKYENLLDEAKRCLELEREMMKKTQEEVDAQKAILREGCGFFNKYGRVKLIRLKGIPSQGYIFSLDEIRKYKEIGNVDLEALVGQDFDTIDGELFVKAYVPPIKEKKTNERSNDKRAKKLEKKFDRLIDGEFKFHYDTSPLAKNMHLFKPTDIVTVSCKIHGTSVIIANVKVKNQIKLPFYKKLWNLITDNKWLHKYMIQDWYEDYGPVYSSRTVIKNKYLNPNKGQGYYNVDVWSEWGERMSPYIPKGMTIYGEIYGYCSDSDRMIQKGYDYGCEVGTNKMMIYRITTKDEEGKFVEWNVEDVRDWTEKLIEENDELKGILEPITILYHGEFKDMYPNLDTELHWNENVLEEMKNDSVMLGMELLEPLCHNQVPREGVVLRVDNDPVNEAFKLKSEAFKFRESNAIDAGEIDIEMSENNY